MNGHMAVSAETLQAQKIHADACKVHFTGTFKTNMQRRFARSKVGLSFEL